MTYSIIVPIYNSAKDLHRCYDSICNQNKKVDNVVFLVDDGSWDTSPERIDELLLVNSDVMVIHQKNKGPASARNKGVLLSASDYVLFVDSDDYISENYLSVISSNIDDNNVDILVFGMASSLSKTTPTESKTVIGNNAVLAHYCDTWNIVDYYSSCNKAFSRKMLLQNNVLFMDDSTVEEDFVFNLRVLDNAHSVRQVTDIIYYYDQKEVGSLTTSYNPRRFQGKLLSYNEEICLLTKWGLLDLVKFQKQQLINFVSVAVNNLLYGECTLSYRGKIQEIKKYFNNPQVRECVGTVSCSTLRTKLMAIFIRYRLYCSCYFLHAIVRLIKNSRKRVG